MTTRYDLSDLVAAAAGAAGVFLVGFFGSEALFAPASAGVALEITLIPSLAAATAAFGYFLTGQAEAGAASLDPEPVECAIVAAPVVADANLEIEEDLPVELAL